MSSPVTAGGFQLWAFTVVDSLLLGHRAEYINYHIFSLYIFRMCMPDNITFPKHKPIRHLVPVYYIALTSIKCKGWWGLNNIIQTLFSDRLKFHLGIQHTIQVFSTQYMYMCNIKCMHLSVLRRDGWRRMEVHVYCHPHSWEYYLCPVCAYCPHWYHFQYICFALCVIPPLTDDDDDAWIPPSLTRYYALVHFR